VFETAGRKAVSSRIRHHTHIDCLFKHQFIALASMWCQDFTRIKEKWRVHDLNMSSDSPPRGVWNGRANGSFKSNLSSHTHIDCLFEPPITALASMRCQNFTRIEEKPKGRYTTYLCQVTPPHVGFETAGRKAVSSWFCSFQHIDCLFKTSNSCTCKYVVPRFHSDRGEIGCTRPEYVKWLDVTWGLKRPGERQFQVEFVIIHT